MNPTGKLVLATFGLALGRASLRFGLARRFLRPAHRLTCCSEAFLQRLHDVHDRKGWHWPRLTGYHFMTLNLGGDQRLDLLAILVPEFLRLEFGGQSLD